MSSPPADLDYALLRRLTKGDHGALAELIRRHQPRLHHLAHRLLKDSMEAEDALQEVFLKVFEHAASFEPQSTVAAWLNRITANHCLNRLRQRRPAGSLDRDDAPETPDAGPSPLDALEEADLNRRLEALLAALPENQRRALILKRFGDLTYAEIGAEMGLSPQAVDGLLKRARQTLKAALQEYL